MEKDIESTSANSTLASVFLKKKTERQGKPLAVNLKDDTEYEMDDNNFNAFGADCL